MRSTARKSYSTKRETGQTTQPQAFNTGAICLVTGLTITAAVVAQALPAQVVAGVTAGTAVAQASHTASAAVKSVTQDKWLSLDAAQRSKAAASSDASSFSQLPTWPEADLDSFSSTDFEDLAAFAADVFEFVQQEYAMLVAAYGESRLATIGGAALWALVRLYRAIASSRRLK